MTRNTLILFAFGGSAALLIGAYTFQALGYAPCQMCLWQRWPHGAAILIGLLALRFPGPVLPILGALAALTTGLTGAFHSGVEQGWWEGPASCTGSGLSGDLLSLDAVHVVMCDEISWQFLGLSMPTWNAICSLFLVAIWIKAARAKA